MGKIKEKYFDDINREMEKVRFEKALSECPLTNFSPIVLMKKLSSQFQLTDDEMIKIVRGYYKF
jgi:hypothetical protein